MTDHAQPPDTTESLRATILDHMGVLFEHYLACPDWGDRADGSMGPCRKADCPVCSSHELVRDVRTALARLEAAERHYQEHVDCGNGCTCYRFVREWEAALAREEKPS